MKNSYLIIGVMSGSSLDGLDLAACRFDKKKTGWDFDIMATDFISYEESQRNKLSNLNNVNGMELIKAHADYGVWTGDCVKKFIKKNALKPDLIASHGHTIFHEPDDAFSFQLGSPAHIASQCGINCAGDFRNTDMANGGQGAPLAPVSDFDLFPEYDICVNLGGIANISYADEKKVSRGYDITICNLILNHLASGFGKTYDNNGNIGKKGELDHNLLLGLESLKYYKSRGAKSIDKVWFYNNIQPLFSKATSSLNDKMHTAYVHIADMIAAHIEKAGQKSKVLFSGGGAKNKYLVQLIQDRTSAKICIPDEEIIDFKESLLMAYVGLLRLLEKNNSVSSVTGAKQASSGGGVYLG